ncbi:MAG: hypothetical protein ACRDQU_05150 [Pseudonocardiaceae bacterium]
MRTMIVFETHSWSEDNDRGVGTGWLPGRLSERGRELARELGLGTVTTAWPPSSPLTFAEPRRPPRWLSTSQVHADAAAG